MTGQRLPAAGEHGRSDIPSRDRLPTLTGLRFWAALLVVLYHLDSKIGVLPYVDWLVAYGRTGVTFFFVLSGFVLAWNYLDQGTSFLEFAWRRFARLWPLVAVTAVLSLIAFHVVGVHVPRWQAATTFIFLQAWRPEWAVGANGAAWSLSDEAFFYALFPIVLAAAARPRLRAAMGGVLLTAYPLVWLVFAVDGWRGWTLDYLPLSRVLQFIAGVLCAVAMRRGMRAPVGYWVAAGGVVAFHLGLQVWERNAHDWPLSWGPYSGSEWWAMPFFALLIMAAAQRDLEDRPTLARGPVSLRLGHWSYAWYLIHEVCIRVWVHEVTPPDAYLARLVTWIALLGVTLLAAFLLYTLVEHPAERALRRRFSRKDEHARRRPTGRPPGSVSSQPQM